MAQADQAATGRSSSRPEAHQGESDGRPGTGFWIVTAALGWALVAAAAPSPLYAGYAARWHFGPTMLTVVFAVYALSLLVALLVFGSVSDAVGRRPVIIGGLVLLAGSMALFLVANGIGWLLAARLTQGVATALVTAGVAAALIDLQPASRPGLGAVVNAVTPSAGLAIGGLLAGALVQYLVAPLRTVYAVLLVGCLLLVVLVLRMPESGGGRGPVQLRPRIGIEPQARGAFLAMSPALTATWALGGLYLSLGPSLLLTIAGSTNHLLGGAAVFALCAPAAAACLAARSWAPVRAVRAGCLLLIGGLAITVVGIRAPSAAVLLIGTVIAGGGFGLGFLGAFRAVLSTASPARRGELVSAVYVVAYLAFSVPAVIAGILTTRIGLTATAGWYAAAVGLLSLLALLATFRRSVVVPA